MEGCCARIIECAVRYAAPLHGDVTKTQRAEEVCIAERIPRHQDRIQFLAYITADCRAIAQPLERRVLDLKAANEAIDVGFGIDVRERVRRRAQEPARRSGGACGRSPVDL